MNGYFITGTDTEIGKTIVTALLTLGFRQNGVNCCPIKPIASGGQIYEGTLVSEDALVYRDIVGLNVPLNVLNPLCLQKAASPHLAAQLEGVSIQPEEMLLSIESFAKQYEMVLVEGVGGWRAPITESFWVSDLAKQLGLPVIVVSANRLGAINHTLMTLECIRQSGQTLAGVIMNTPQPIEDPDIAEDNIRTIEKLGQVNILGNIPYLDEKFWQGNSTTKWDLVKNYWKSFSSGGF